MIVSLLFVIMVCFSFGVGSLLRMFLIVMMSILSGLYVYSVVGFSWYLLLFVLVYVGGVCILFIYLSIMIPNVGLNVACYSYSVMFIGCLYLLILSGNWIISSVDLKLIEYSVYLCDVYEGLIYLFFCLMLLIGLILINIILSSFSGYAR
uniref:NADH dehydrogenase subunit 6 n=1 Tax=Schistosoma turkestanicum TaxID=1163369 RepID=G4WCP9_9TREM|nr:NADH dehydrogenase subunit 6 [Schistosoma turkestanicum]